MSQIETLQLSVSITLIQEKLDRIRNYIVRLYSFNGRLSPEYQHVLRILDSRKRELQRILLLRIRPEQAQDRRCAEIELSVKHKDNGDLFRWSLLNHAYGRLSCPGCAYDYVTDSVLGLPVKVIKSKPCPVCGRGIMHTYPADTAQEALEAVLSFWEAVGVDPKLQIHPEPNVRDAEGTESPVLVYCCDACYNWQVEPCN
jgi:hypothetical protein